MNKKLISTVIGTALSGLVATTGYAWPPTQACLDARLNHAVVMDAILVCKDYDPNGAWICEKPLRTAATQEKKDTLAIAQKECRGEALAETTSFDAGDILPIKFLPPPCPSAIGEWSINFDWHNDDSWGNAMIEFNPDFTTSPHDGGWTQTGCDFELRFETTYGNTVYTGTMTSDGSGMSGNMSTTIGNGADGSWNAMPAIDMGISPPASVPFDGGTYIDGSTD